MKKWLFFVTFIQMQFIYNLLNKCEWMCRWSKGGLKYECYRCYFKFDFTGYNCISGIFGYFICPSLCTSSDEYM